MPLAITYLCPSIKIPQII